MNDIVEVTVPTAFNSAALRERAVQCKQPRSRQFAAYISGAEAGYLSFDYREDLSIGVIYELLVLPEYRGRGLGTRLLRFGESLAESLSCDRVRLNPTAFDRSVDQAWLESWYSLRGYAWAADGTTEMEKVLVKEAHDV